MGTMKDRLDSVFPAVRVPRKVRQWLKKKARTETEGNEGELIRGWINEKKAQEERAAAESEAAP